MAGKNYLLVMIIVVVISSEIHCQWNQDSSEEDPDTDGYTLFGSGGCPPTQQFDRIARRCITPVGGKCYSVATLAPLN